MKNKGQLGQILTSFPSLFFVFVIMLAHVIISGYLSKDISSIEYKSPVTPYEREIIAEHFPEKNIVQESLIVTFLDSEISVGSEIVKVEYAIEQMCRSGGGLYFRTELAPILERKFSSLTKNGKFAIARKIGFDKNVQYQVYSSNFDLGVNDLGEISLEKFNEFFSPESLKVQEKTLCVEGGKSTTVYVIPGDNNEQ